MNQLGFLLMIVADVALAQDRYVGSFEPYDHDVSGEVYIHSDTELRLTQFNYDGQGPGTWYAHVLLKNIHVAR